MILVEVVCRLIIDDAGEHRNKTTEVGIDSGAMTCAMKFRQIGTIPRQSQASLCEQLVEKLASTAPVALPKRVRVVHVVVQVRDLLRKLGPRNRSQPVRLRNLHRDMAHRLIDVSLRTERFTLLNADRPKMTCPLVHVLEQLAMYRREMRQIVRAIEQIGILSQFQETNFAQVVFGILQLNMRAGMNPVPQNIGPWQEIRFPVSIDIICLPGQIRH